MTTSTTPRWLQTSLCVGALGVLSLALVYCGSDGSVVTPEEEARDQETAADVSAAVAAGEMTEEEARNRAARIRFREAAVRIREAIAAGEITEEEGRERLAELRRRMAGGSDEGGR